MMKRCSIGKAELTIFPSAEELHAGVATEFLRVISSAVQAKPRCAVALTGGGTARAYYKLIAEQLAREPQLQQLAWDRVDFFWGDERAVPPSDPQSNYRMAAETLLSSPALARAQQHRIHAELPPAQAAAQYEKELRKCFGAELPSFSLLLLGMGDEGHVASLFPGSAALQEHERWVVENWVEKLNAFRITMTLPVLNNADCTLFVVVGEQKRSAIRKIFIDREPLPAAQVQPEGRLLWFLDATAGADLL